MMHHDNMNDLETDNLIRALELLPEDERRIYLDAVRRKHNIPMSTEAFFYTDEDQRARVMIPKLYIEENEDGHYFGESPVFNKKQLRAILPLFNRFLATPLAMWQLDKLLNADDFDEAVPEVSVLPRKQRCIIAMVTVLSRFLPGEKDAMRFMSRMRDRFGIDPVTFDTECSKIKSSSRSNPVSENVRQLMAELESYLDPGDRHVPF